MNILRQLAKEFWLPLVVAVAWAVFVVSSQDKDSDLHGVITSFGSAFFFMSWLLGQWFRVSKQVRVEGSFSELAKRLEGIAESLTERTRDLSDLMTGGSSFATLTVMNPVTPLARVFVANNGSHPVYGLQVRIVHLAAFDEAMQNKSVSLDGGPYEQILNAGDIIPHHGVDCGVLNFVLATDERLNCFFTARNGSWTQQIKLRKDGDDWKQIYIVTRNDVDGEPIKVARSDASGFPEEDLFADWNDFPTLK